MAAHAARHFGGGIGAVVGHQPNIDELLRIGLRLDAGDEIADDVLLIACGDQHGIPLVHRGFGEPDRLGEQGDENAHRLIDHARAADDDQDYVQYAQQYHLAPPTSRIVVGCVVRVGRSLQRPAALGGKRVLRDGDRL